MKFTPQRYSKLFGYIAGAAAILADEWATHGSWSGVFPAAAGAFLVWYVRQQSDAPPPARADPPSNVKLLP